MTSGLRPPSARSSPTATSCTVAKGTIGAIRRVVEPGVSDPGAGWWQETPAATPGTFKLDIGVLDTGITETMYQELERLIADASP